MKKNSFELFLQEMTVRYPGRDIQDEILTAIVGSDRHKRRNDPRIDCNGVHISEAYAHNALNYTLSGTILFEGITYGFIVDDGDWNGTDVREWGLEDDVGGYEPPPPTIWTMIPNLFFRSSEHDYIMFKDVYLKWREEAWFKKICSDFMYDKHFAPSLTISVHYRKLAEARGLTLVVWEEFEQLLKKFNEFDTWFNALTPEQQRNAFQ